jgi:hypothetical protein
MQAQTQSSLGEEPLRNLGTKEKNIQQKSFS